MMMLTGAEWIDALNVCQVIHADIKLENTFIQTDDTGHARFMLGTCSPSPLDLDSAPPRRFWGDSPNKD